MESNFIQAAFFSASGQRPPAGIPCILLAATGDGRGAVPSTRTTAPHHCFSEEGRKAKGW